MSLDSNAAVIEMTMRRSPQGRLKTPAFYGDVPAAPSRDDQVRELFERFAQAMSKGDGMTIAELWSTPGMVIFNDRSITLSDTAAVEKMFSTAHQVTADVKRMVWTTERVGTAEVSFGPDEKWSFTVQLDSNGLPKIKTALKH
jgi:hypothetical protein